MALSDYQWIKRILHPTDLKEESSIAFNHALRIALNAKAEIDILHVDAFAKSLPDWSKYPHVRDTLEQWHILADGAVKEDVLTETGLKVIKANLASLQPVEAIVDFTENKPADMVVMGTHGREGIARWVKPSFAETLSRAVKRPALFVPNEAKGFVSPDDGSVRIERVLIPVDHRPYPQLAVKAAAAFLRSLNVRDAHLQTLHIGNAPDHEGPKLIAPDNIECQFEAMQVTGNPVEEILKQASAVNTDLIVMATEGHHGFLDAVRGSTTEQIIHKATCPVLAIPTD